MSAFHSHLRKAACVSLIAFGCLTTSTVSLAQGTVLFSNLEQLSGVDAPVFDVDGMTLLEGPAYLAQLYAGPSAEVLDPVGKPEPLYEGLGAGYVIAGSVQVPSVAPGQIAVVQMRAWEAAAGETYEEALVMGGKVGASGLVQVVTGGGGAPPAVPASLVGLQSFHLVLPPEFTPMAPWGIPELVLLRVRPNLVDNGLPPRDWIFLSGPDNPPGLTVDAATGEVVWLPVEAEGPGVYGVTVVVVDPVVPGVEGSVTFEVTVSEVNTAPVLELVSAEIAEGDMLSLALVTTDGDLPENQLHYELVDGPPGVSLVPETGQLSWIPGEGDGPGSWPVQIRVTDDGVPALWDDQTVTIAVTEVNEPPTLAEPEPWVVLEETPGIIRLQGADPDRPANLLTYATVGEVPEGLVVDAATGEIRWTPAEEQGPGEWVIVVRVMDNGVPLLMAERQLELQVSEVNDPPYLEAPETVVSDEEVPLSFVVVADDRDDVPANTVTLAVGDLPDGASFDAETGLFSWTPTEWQQGEYVLEFEAVDDGEPVQEVAKSVKLTIQEVNDAPTLVGVPDQEVEQDGVLGPLVILVDDVDSPVEGLSMVGTSSDAALVPPEGLVWSGEGAERILTVTPAEGAWGSATVRIEVSDGSALAVSEFNLRVLRRVTHTGTVFDGYIAAAKVFLDVDGDRVHDEGEPWGMTDAQGRFSVDYLVDRFDADGDGVLGAAEARWVTVGGRDKATGHALRGSWEALPGSRVISPLTTLMAAILDGEPELDEGAAQQRIVEGLALPGGVDLQAEDTWGQALSGDLDAVAVLQAAAMVQDTVVQISAVLEAYQSEAQASVASTVMAALAAQLGEETVPDLTVSGGVEAVMEAASARVGVAVSPEVKQGAASVVAQLNEAKLLVVEQAVDAVEAVQDLTRVQVVAQGVGVEALTTAVVTEELISDVVVAFTGESLLQQLSWAPVGDLTGTDTRPGTFEWGQATYTAGENSAAALPVTLVRRDGSSGEVGLRVFVVEASGSAGAEDFLAQSFDVTFADGEIVSTLDLGAWVLDDDLVEGTESCLLAVELTTSSPEGVQIGALAQATLHIVDSDSAGRFEFTRDEFVVREDGLAVWAVTLARSEGSQGEVRLRVYAEPLDGEALSGIDFAMEPVEVVFAAGALQRQVQLPLVDDAIHERNERVTLRVELVSGEALGAELGARVAALLVIQDDDPSREPLLGIPAQLDPERVRIQGLGDAEVDYGLEWTEDFGTWNDGAVVRSDAMGLWEVEIPVVESGTQRFYRVKGLTASE